MRFDLATWVPEEMAVLASVLEDYERLAAVLGEQLSPEVGLMKRSVHSYLASRAPGRADATTRPGSPAVPHAGEHRWLTSEEVAAVLRCTDDAVRKACRSGRFCGVARKVRGRWLIPAVEVEAA